jgi:cyclase
LSLASSLESADAQTVPRSRFNGFFPFVDTENGGDVGGLIANVEKVLATIPDDAKVIPGHGPLSDKAGLRRFLDMLRNSLAAVEAGIDAGKSFEQLKAEKVLTPWQEWGGGFIKSDMWTESLYKEATSRERRLKK